MKQIGEGGFGVVWLVMKKNNDEVFVSKQIQRTELNDLLVSKEIDTLRLLKGLHVIEFVEKYQSRKTI